MVMVWHDMDSEPLVRHKVELCISDSVSQRLNLMISDIPVQGFIVDIVVKYVPTTCGGPGTGDRSGAAGCILSGGRPSARIS